eukprot:1424408-Amphidinium_carterae.1
MSRNQSKSYEFPWVWGMKPCTSNKAITVSNEFYLLKEVVLPLVHHSDFLGLNGVSITILVNVCQFGLWGSHLGLHGPKTTGLCRVFFAKTKLTFRTAWIDAAWFCFVQDAVILWRSFGFCFSLVLLVILVMRLNATGDNSFPRVAGVVGEKTSLITIPLATITSARRI